MRSLRRWLAGSAALAGALAPFVRGPDRPAHVSIDGGGSPPIVNDLHERIDDVVAPDAPVAPEAPIARRRGC